MFYLYGVHVPAFVVNQKIRCVVGSRKGNAAVFRFWQQLKPDVPFYVIEFPGQLFRPDEGCVIFLFQLAAFVRRRSGSGFFLLLVQLTQFFNNLPLGSWA